MFSTNNIIIIFPNKSVNTLLVIWFLGDRHHVIVRKTRKEMKNITKLLTIVSLFIILSSCTKEQDSLILDPNNETNTNLKDEDDDDFIFVAVPTVHDQLILSQQKLLSGVTVTLVGIDVLYSESTNLDSNNYFTFNNVPNGTFRLEIYVDSQLDDTKRYIVTY